jgi:hypothetical protein
MGMPAWLYRWFYGAHVMRALRRNVLGFMGLAPLRQTLIGRVEGLPAARFEALRHEMQSLGRRALSLRPAYHRARLCGHPALRPTPVSG